MNIKRFYNYGIICKRDEPTDTKKRKEKEETKGERKEGK